MTLSNLRNLTVPTLLTASVILASILLASSTKVHPLSASDLRLEVARFRPLEAQLSVGQHYDPCEVMKVPIASVPWSRCQVDPSESSVDAKTLLKATSVIDESDPWSSGLVYLLWIKSPANLDRAIERLERAHNEAPSDSARTNDLAAALVERAERRNQPADLVAALELLERSVRNGVSEPWLLFNRALVLEKLRLLTIARSAWLRYLNDYPKSSWRSEARSHFGEVTSYMAAQVEPVNRYLYAAAKAVDASRLKDIANRYPREAREFVLEVALKQWSEALLADNNNEAWHWFDTVRILGEELVELGGDHTVLDVADEIKSVQGQEERRLAYAYQLYASGHQLFRERDYSRAGPLLRSAWLQLTELGSPIVGWVLFDLGANELYSNNSQGAVELFSGLLKSCDVGVHPALCGRAEWARGLGLFRLGRLEKALAAYRAAAMAFVPTREIDNYASALELVAETLRELGDTSSAWQYRYQGLRILGGQTRHISKHNLLWEGGGAALEEGYPLASELFADEDVELFGGGPDRLLALEAYLRRAQFRRGRASTASVLADLDRAVEIAQHELPKSPLVLRIEADVRLALAQIAVDRAPQQAEEGLSQSLKFFRQHRLVLQEAATLLISGRLAKSRGNVAQAQRDLEAAVGLFEERRSQLAGDDQRLYNETWQGVYDELIELAAIRPDGAQDALQLLERSRRDGARQGLSSAIDSNTVIVAFAVHNTVFYRFQIRASTVGLVRFAVQRPELAAKVHELVSLLRSGSNSERVLGELSSLLVPADLPEGALLCFVPDRELVGVPFSALLSQANPVTSLVDHHEVILAPSVHDCEAAGERSAPSNKGMQFLLVQSPRLDPSVFASLPELSEAPAEAAELLKVYPNLILLANENATAPAILKNLSKSTIFHFAGHAVVHPTQPDRSFLPLAPDPSRPQVSLLTASEIASLHLGDLQMVVLSSCGTIAPQASRAEGISGLVHAFLEAGSHAVIGALWEVDDNSSREMMADFYRNFKQTNNAAFSLRAAQMSARSAPISRTHSRSTWAAFELVIKEQKINQRERSSQ